MSKSQEQQRFIEPTPLAVKARLEVLALVERAQTLLYQAAQAACPLRGWVKQWEAVGDHADATKKLWHKLNGARYPVGHDRDPLPVEVESGEFKLEVEA